MSTHQTHSSTTKTPHAPLSVTPLEPDAKAPILRSPLDDTSTDPHSAVYTSEQAQGLAHRTAGEGPGRKEEGKEGWKPKYGRTQSWDKQDWKRALQMSGVGGGEKAGFSEKNEGGQ
ncbi:hypothetical protein VC83_02146 [Pseudogymnoascus destructans]|uniref:Uncharacterized protein n=2 Tax=Pseudogymnoascus destructans TaxID=655981 RepID=L8FU24_PSED2|nr:uncharacterized protein VC83_02146 [Pseudogymnoascus destructans]ELR04392.1 hypothetical protein GMDG_01468 [Pseudogymnoascus destructans 20631-21]OAF61273.1 hypothetical protein VC83_02146 [Pseudogymnoascus destructans]